MKLKKGWPGERRDRLVAEVDQLRELCLREGINLAAADPRMPEALHDVRSAARSPFLAHHLEGAAFFVALFAAEFPGFGLRQEMENETGAREIGYAWSCEPFGPDNMPIGIETEGGYECVFLGDTPLETVVHMLLAFIPVRHLLWKEARDRRAQMPAPDMAIRVDG